MLDVWLNDGVDWVNIGSSDTVQKAKEMVRSLVGVQVVIKDRADKNKVVARFFHEEGQWKKGCN
jgi:hypothetical protein